LPDSGIITTSLGKTATFSKVAGREIRVHHSKSLPLPFTGERFFLSAISVLKYGLLAESEATMGHVWRNFYWSGWEMARCHSRHGGPDGTSLKNQFQRHSFDENPKLNTLNQCKCCEKATEIG
jgi:hypothetical protein